MRNYLYIYICLGLFSLVTHFPVYAQTTEAYRWKDVQIQGGGFVTGLVYSPTQKNLLYARTDVGGAYRWNAANKTWLPLTDHLNRSQQDFTGVLSIATDPSDPNRVYLATGLYTQSWAGTGAILASSDKGQNWTLTKLPVKIGGNENGRSAGERLQVDPNQNSTLYLGSSTDGLWKSTDYAATWSKVNSFPVATTPIGSGGISFVLFDKKAGTAGNATPVIYVGILQNGTNLYKSTDGGATWQAVANQPTNLMPYQAALAADGNLYLTYTNGPGPNDITAGAVWKVNTQTNQWVNVSPPTGQGGFAGLSLDAQNPGTILVSTIDRWWPGDEIYRSTNGGATWKALLATATFDHSLAPYAASSKPHWLGDVEIDPFNSDNSWFVTGYGVFNSNNLAASEQNTATNWIFQNDGLEETVPLKLISPPTGASLVSALGDIDGFKHDDVNASPANRLSPEYGTNTSIDFAEKLPAFMARTHYNAAAKYGAYSTNGGTSWTAFASNPAGANGAGTIAVAADGATLVWSPNGPNSIFYSTNQGTTWSASAGVNKGTLKPVADRVNPKKFYAYDAEDGKMLVSTNGGVSFTTAATNLPTVPGWLLWAASVYPVPGVEGDVWLTNPSGGLYHSTNSGASFTRQAEVPEAVKVGFGKPAAGKIYPAIYLAGTISNIMGFFRSDDAGATWIQINDDQHQFGGVNDITGDPRVFGRVYIATSGRGIVYGDSRIDCNGVLDGTAYLDKCQECVGGTTGKTECVVTGIAEDKVVMAVHYAPNPFAKTIRVQASAAFSYKITSLTGIEIETGSCKGDCNLSKNLKPGIYLLTTWNKTASRTAKIIKQ